MRSSISTGSALALAILAMASTQAAACDDDCDYCGGYGYYASSYGYYPRPAYAYVPGPYYAYYAAPGNAYYAPAYSHYAPPPAYYAPPPVYGQPYGRPNYGWRAGYVDARAVARHRDVPGAPPPARGMYALGAKPGPQIALSPGYAAPAAVRAPSLKVAAPARSPKPRFDARGIAASAAKHGTPGAKLPVVGYAPQPKYIPTAYYGGTAGYVGQRK